MGIVLKVTPEVLKSMAGEIEKQIGDISNQFNLIGSDISGTRSFWEGEASDTHKSQYDGLKDDINEAVNRLRNHPVNLLQMAGLYTETESNIQAVAQSLQEDVIV